MGSPCPQKVPSTFPNQSGKKLGKRGISLPGSFKLKFRKVNKINLLFSSTY
jgi:hypothetical protein